jgi:hypothetical protein
MIQADLVQEALAVTKVQTQALNILVKVPLGGGRYAELTVSKINHRYKINYKCISFVI